MQLSYLNTKPLRPIILAFYFIAFSPGTLVNVSGAGFFGLYYALKYVLS